MRILSKYLLLASAISGALLKPEFAFAITECAETPTNYFLGGSGSTSPTTSGSYAVEYIWFNYSNGGSGVIYQVDPAFNAYVATILTAKLTQRSVTVRYADNNVSCTASNPDPVIGIWLN